MRSVVIDAIASADRWRSSLLLYGPLPDLSGVDASAPILEQPVSPRLLPPAHHRQRHHGAPHHQSLDWAGHHGAPHHALPFHHEPPAQRLYSDRRYEYGLHPFGVKAGDGFGNQSSMTTTSVFVNSAPLPAAALALSTQGGKMRATITEWPDG